MDLFTRDDLNDLTKIHDQHCVSLYLPTERKGADVLQGRLRLKNLLKQTRDQLNEQGMAEGDINRFLAPAQDRVDDETFWQHQSDGLAIFLADDGHHIFRVCQSFDEQAHIARQFYVNPLLPLLQSNGKYYVLAVSQNDVRLLSGDRQGLEELDKASLPKDLQSALGWWHERNVNLHSMQQKPQSRGGDDTAIFHGHYTDQTEHELKTYFRKIDEVVFETLKGQSVPLLFAGVDYLFPLYQEINQYPHLQEQAIVGNPDELNEQQLHEQAWPLIEPLLSRSESELENEFRERAAHELATADLETLLTAAQFGLVETLVISDKAKIPGTYDTESHNATYAEQESQDSQDLVALAVLMTLEASGEVVAFDQEQLPADLPVFALLRAPLSTLVK